MDKENNKIEIDALRSLYEVVMDIYKNRNENEPSNDYNLIVNEVHEQAIAHRIAHYLENRLEVLLKNTSLSVDCEYNKHKNKHKNYDCDIRDYKTQKTENKIEKMVEEIKNDFKKQHITDFSEADIILKLKEKTFRPDIILHERIVDDNNILYVELKKNEVDAEFDKVKLKCVTDIYKYAIGVSIILKKEYPIFTCFTLNDTIASELKALCFENFTINPTLD